VRFYLFESSHAVPRLLMADKAREKLIAKVVKEGGKKGVEIDGAADMARCPGSPRHAAAVEPA